MERHGRIQDLAARIGEQWLPEGRGGIPQGKGAFREPPQGGLDEREIEQEEIPLVERKGAQQNGRAKQELVEGENGEQSSGRRARPFVEVGHRKIRPSSATLRRATRAASWRRK